MLLSGGRDSVCLLDLAVRICGPDAVTALHVNYRLRPEADDEQRHCQTLCAALGARLEVLIAGGPPSSGNIQAWARRVRYARAAALARPLEADVAAGHTASDQVETILYRLASSPSRRALLGMPERDGSNPAVVRPLLGVWREQTTAYCRARGLRFVDDPTNDGDRYARGRVRGRLVAALEAVHPAARENVLAVAEILRAEAQVLDELVEQALGVGGSSAQDGGAALATGGMQPAAGESIPVSRLRSLPRALRRLVVQRLADGAAGRPAAGVARRADDVAALGEGKLLDLPVGVRAGVRDGILRFQRTPLGVRRGPSSSDREEAGTGSGPIESRA